MSNPCSRTVLVVVHTVASCSRLLDVIEFVESDSRVQVVFTVAPDVFNRSVEAHLLGLGALVLPWRQAIRERFDLALAASYGGLASVHAPLMLMAHGAGHGKVVRRRHGSVVSERPVYGLDAQRLTQDGAVLASALLLAHERERSVLQRQCPEALEVAVVVGDPCFDRLLASVPWRARYRRTMGVGDDQELVVVASTWGKDGLFGRVPDLLSRLNDQLPAHRFRIAALLHPAVWEAHGARQIRAWAGDSVDAGLILPAPTDDWRALVVAADRVIGDHGSVTAYAAALGRPVLHLPPEDSGVTAPESAQRFVTARSGGLDPDAPLLTQVRAARPADPTGVADMLTSRPGAAGVLIRREMYRLLGLEQPGRHRRTTPVPVPSSPGTAVDPSGDDAVPVGGHDDRRS